MYHIRQVFEILWTAHLSMKLSKCQFFTKEIQYLGHILITTGIKPLPSKTQAVNDMHPSKAAKQVCTFLGLVRYYRKFIKDFPKIAKPPNHINLPQGQVLMDPKTPYNIYDAEGRHYTSPYLMLS